MCDNNPRQSIFCAPAARFNAEYAFVTNDFAKLRERAADDTKLGWKTGMSDVSANWRMSKVTT